MTRYMTGHPHLRAGAAALALAVAILTAGAGEAKAQTDASPNASSEGSEVLGEIIVNARRKAENLQDVPLAVTAVSEADLQRQDLRTASDLERSIPGLSICCGRGQALSPFIRGVPGVIGYFADVPVPLDGGGQYFDVGSVQVLKGPQGTLFGLSTNGGAILYEPNAPEDRLGGRISVVGGTRNRATVEAVLNAPITPSLSIRLAGQYQSIDGYIKDISTGRKLGGDDYGVLRGSVSFHPSDAVNNLTIVEYWKSTGTPYPAIIRAVDPNGYFSAIFGKDRVNALLAQQKELGAYKVAGLAASAPQRDDMQFKVINRTTVELAPQLTLKNIFGYVEARSYSYYDRAGTPFPLLTVNAPPTHPPAPTGQISEEVQLSGEAIDRKLSFVLGGFYRKNYQDPVLGYNITLGRLSGTRSDTEAETRALYAEGEYDFSDLVEGLHVLAGYRYSWDKRMASQDQVSATGVVGASYSEHGKWDKGSYRVGARYEFADRASVYFINSRGYSSGGFNLTAPDGLRRFEPESLNNFELGLKSDWQLGGVSGRLNLAGYIGKYNDIQVPVTSRVETTNGPVVAVVTQNAAKGKVKGIEGEFALVPVGGLELSGNFSWMDARYTHYVGLNPTGTAVVDLSDTAFVYVPKWKYTLAGSYDLPIPQDAGTLTLSADYTWQSKAVTGARPKPVPFYYIRPSFETLNVSLSWRNVMGHEGWDATAFVTNVTKNTLSNGGFNVYDVLGVWALNSAEPRTAGLRLTYSF